MMDATLAQLLNHIFELELELARLREQLQLLQGNNNTNEE